MHSMEERYRTILFIILLVIFGYWSFLLLHPFMTYLVLGIILAFLVYPVYWWLSKGIGEGLAAFFSILLVLIVIIIPSIWLAMSLVAQGTNAYHLVVSKGLTGSAIFDTLQAWTAFDITPYYTAALNTGKDFAAKALPHIITGTSSFFIGLVIFFFVFYYGLKDGKEWYAHMNNALPLKNAQKNRLQQDIKSMTRSLFYGQMLTAALIGIGCGAVFWYFGIPNAVLWGFIMMLLAFLPFLGAPIVYLPAAIILALQSRWIPALGILLLCTIIIFIVEYIVRPKFVSKTGQIHPVIVIAGALGGIYLLGFVGFLIGPLILGIFTTLLSFDYDAE